VATMSVEQIRVLVADVEIPAHRVEMREIPASRQNDPLERMLSPLGWEGSFLSSEEIEQGQGDMTFLVEERHLQFNGIVLEQQTIHKRDSYDPPLFWYTWRSSGAPVPVEKPMTHADAFLAAIIAEPDDDALRLIFADYLDDHGQPERAEFIRVQCKLAKLEAQEVVPVYESAVNRAAIFNAVLDYQREQLRQRERELLFAANSNGTHTNRCAWFEPFRKFCLVTQERDGWEFRRGFVESVTLSAADFYQHAAALFRAAPLTAVRLANLKPQRATNGSSFNWYSAPVGGIPYWIRQDLFQCLPLWMGQYAMNYSTAEAAHAALSQACVAFGRKAAGGTS